MTIERIGLAARYCDAAIFNGIVFLAGHVPEQTEGRSLTEQTEEVLALLENLRLTKPGKLRPRRDEGRKAGGNARLADDALVDDDSCASCSSI